jgi:hypothetical protein
MDICAHEQRPNLLLLQQEESLRLGAAEGIGATEHPEASNWLVRIGFRGIDAAVKNAESPKSQSSKSNHRLSSNQEIMPNAIPIRTFFLMGAD